MTRFWQKMLAMLLTLFLLMSCGKPDLDRTEAKLLIERSTSISQFKTKIPIHASALDTGTQMGWWQTDGVLIPRNFHPSLKDEFVKMHGVAFERSYAIMEISENLSSKTSLEIEVTGISGDPKGDVRTIEYAWKYVNLPQYSKYIAVEGGRGKAEARLYDDGWRVSDRILMVPSKTPFKLTPEEDAYRLAAITNLENARRNAAEARAKSIAEFNELVDKARVSNDVQQVLSFAGSPTWCCNEKVIVTIYNGGITVERFEIRKNAGERSVFRRSVLFSDVPRQANAPPIVAGFQNGGMYMGGIQVLGRVSDEVRKSEAHLAAINAVNSMFTKWLQKSGLDGRCPNSRKWGCNKFAGA